jgi:hypothetical protein
MYRYLYLWISVVCAGCSSLLTYAQVLEAEIPNMTVLSQPENVLVLPTDQARCPYQEQTYDLRKEFQRLVDLKNEGKKIYLIVGRSSDEDQPELSVEDDVVWVYADVAPPAYYDEEDPIQLVMNFEYPNFLRHIQSNLFTRIIFDRSVWKSFQSREFDFKEYQRILVRGGSLYFEQDIIGGMIGIKEMNKNFEFDRDNAFSGSLSIHKKFQLVHMSFSSPDLKREHEEMWINIRKKITADTLRIGPVFKFSKSLFHEQRIYPIKNKNYSDQANYFEFVK